MADFETREADWLEFRVALERVQTIRRPLAVVSEPIESAVGLAAAEEVVSSLTLPPGPTSHMDGYAVRAGDLTPSPDVGFSDALPVVGTSLPGAPFRNPLPPKGAVRIMTGSLLPEGADTVVPVERTDRETGATGSVRISFERAAADPFPRQGSHVRPPGEEVKEGERLAQRGDTVTPGLLALIAATGVPAVRAHPRPTVALLVTGSELVPAGDPAALAGGIRRVDILSPTLPAFVQQAGGTALAPRRVRDDREETKRAFREAASGADMIVTTGGASMGEADLLKGVLDEMGFELDFWRVRMRPGSPVSFGRLPVDDDRRAVPVLGLPGNPVSSFVTFLTLGWPALRALGGHSRRVLPTIRATARETMPGPEDLTVFLRVRLEPEAGGRWGARLSAPQGSGAIRNFALADGLAVLPEGVGSLRDGADIAVTLLPHAGWPGNG